MYKDRSSDISYGGHRSNPIFFWGGDSFKIWGGWVENLLKYMYMLWIKYPMDDRIARNEITVLERRNDLFLMDIHVNESKLSPLGVIVFFLSQVTCPILLMHFLLALLELQT